MTRRSPTREPDVLEQNVTTLLEAGGEPPRMAEAARARIRAELIARHGAVETAPTRTRTPLVAVGLGLAAAAAAALVATRLVGGDAPSSHDGTAALADGSTFIAEPGAKVSVLGPRHLRVEGAALLDVTPGHGPFVVDTAHGTIRVLGTRFLVDGEHDRTTAAVVRGQVELASDAGTVLLHAGEQGVAEAGRPPVRGPAPRLSHLVSWAREARRRAEHDLEPIHHGTLFARDPGVRSHPPWGQEYPLPIKHLGVDIVVQDQVARVALDQTFHNDEDQTLEGVYRFAIPPDAALQRLAMYVDGKLTESAVVARMRARRIYEELVYRRVDPALLEWAGTGRLDLRVYPIPPRQDKRLMVAYTQSLPKLYDDWTLSVPLPEVDQPVGELDVTMKIAGCANCELSSTSHPIEVTRQGEDALVRVHRVAEKLADSFVLHVRDPRHRQTVAARTDGSDRYLLVRAPADLGAGPRPYRPRTWVLLDDVSASRSALERRAQADLVDAFLRELDEDDRVAVIAFDVEARQKLAPTRVLDVDRKAVRASLAGEGGVGVTDFTKALDAAVTTLAGTAPDDAMIVYLGDGVITSGATKLDALRAQVAGKAHFVGVGVGDGPDTQTLDALAAATGGYATTIDLADDLGWRAFDLVAALHTARVTDLEARLVDAAGTPVPATAYLRSPQLADGEELELVARIAGPGTPVAVELTGRLAGAPWRRTIPLDAAGDRDAGYLPRLWAQRHIAALLLAKHEPVPVPPCPEAKAKHCPSEAELREARDEEIRHEVVALGKRYFLLSRHTSLLVLENDAMYKAYGVTKGEGDTWAPYAMPARIAVASSSAPKTQAVPSNVARDAELVRTPSPVFFAPYDGNDWGGLEEEQADEWGVRRQGWIGRGHLGMRGRGAGGGGVATGYGFGFGKSGGTLRTETRATLGLVGGEQPDVDDLRAGDVAGGVIGGGRGDGLQLDQPAAGPVAAFDPKPEASEKTKAQLVTTAELGGGGREADRHARYRADFRDTGASMTWSGVGAPSLVRYTYPADPAFDDLTALVPALVPDAADRWRIQLQNGAGDAPHAIDPAARALLERARRALPTGVYRWGDRELAIDGAHRIGWHLTTETGLAETASFDGTALTRRYGELDLDVTRAVREDDVALGLAYLPIWIADPAHYARWFDVQARGGHEVALSRPRDGKPHVELVLRFDDQSRLVAITDDEGNALVEVTWSSAGPTAARVLGEAVPVGFTGQAIADAALWAHAGTQPGVAVALPAHLVAYAQDQVTRAAAGTPAWRDAEHQLMVSAAAVGDRATLWQAYEALRAQGGLRLGELVLASAGVARQGTEAAFAAATAPLADQPVARYLAAGRAYLRASRANKLAPATRAGAIGALWSLRAVTAQLAARGGKAAVDELVAMNPSAPALRLIGAALISNHWEVPAREVGRAWDAAATGRYVNVARAQAAQALYNRGDYEGGAERVAQLVAALDLGALPPRLDIAPYLFRSSRRGDAGWQIVWASWRDRVLAGTSYAHVMSLLPLASGRPGELAQLLARAAVLAGDDVPRRIEVVRAAISSGQAAWARGLLEPLLRARPGREVHQLAAQLALAQGKTGEALDQLEAAQVAGADEPVDLSIVRGELSQILAVARQVALESTGAARAKAVQRALSWGDRWRQIDPSNAAIDEQLGEMLLAVGDREGAWRQLSTTIERDPWSGSGYMTVAEAFERQGKVEDALAFWQQAIVIDQTNPTPRLRKAQALIALGRTAEGDALLHDITSQHWHDIWSNVVWQARELAARGRR